MAKKRKRGKQPKGSPRLTYKSLADRYGVSLSVIWEAIHGKTYGEGGGSTEGVGTGSETPSL